jgi:hypothetical protein
MVWFLTDPMEKLTLIEEKNYRRFVRAALKNERKARLFENAEGRFAFAICMTFFGMIAVIVIGLFLILEVTAK